jgi:hypothetical protein
MSIEQIKSYVSHHPYKVAGIALGVIVLYYLYESRLAANANSESTTSSDTSSLTPAELDAESGLQQAELASQTQLGSASINAGVSNNAITAQLQTNLANTAATEQGNTLSAQTSQIIAGLQAQVANNTTNAGVATAQIQATAYENISSAPYAAAVDEDEIQAQEAEALAPTNADIESLVNDIANLGSNVSNNTAALVNSPFTSNETALATAYNSQLTPIGGGASSAPTANIQQLLPI